MGTSELCSKELAKLLKCGLEQGELLPLLKDLLTDLEIETILNRWLAFKLLLEGKTHRDVQKELGISIAKVTHAANLLKVEGKGVKALFQRLKGV